MLKPLSVMKEIFDIFLQLKSLGKKQPYKNAYFA